MKTFIYIFALVMFSTSVKAQTTQTSLHGNNSDKFSFSDDKTEVDALHVFPNPSNGVLQAQFPPTYNGNGSLIVYDNSGIRVSVNEHLTKNSTRIDLSSLQAGLYLAQFKLGNEIYTERIIITNK